MSLSICLLVLVILLVSGLVPVANSMWRRSRRNAAAPDSPNGTGFSLATKAEIFVPGVYLLRGRRCQRSEIIVSTASRYLPGIFLDLVEELGEEVLLVLGEFLREGNLPPVISFCPPLESSELQVVLSEYDDVIKLHPGVEFYAQNIEKCCHLVLTPRKHIVLDACNPIPYLKALERRGLRQVEEPQLALLPVESPGFASLVDEIRLDELKHLLSARSSTFYPQEGMVH